MCKWKRTKGRNQQTVYSHLANILNKRHTGLNGHLSISDFTLTYCQRLGAHIFKKQNTFQSNFTNFPVFKDTIKRIAFENAFESSIIFQRL